MNLLCGGFCARRNHVAAVDSATEAATAAGTVPSSNPCVPVFRKAGARRYGREAAAIVSIVIAEVVVMVTDVRPNITGGFTAHDGRQGDKSSGAFYLVSNLGHGDRDSGTPDMANLLRYGFDGSRCSALYGKSSTVQPPSFRALAIIKF